MMDYACKISVIIPVYNMAQYLDQTISSWTAQTLKNIEVIYIDDGSSDDSLRILEGKAKTDDRIHVCSFSTNKGPWAARNYGLEKAAGQYILFADADDTVLPETCEELVLAMDEAQVDILQYSIKVLNPNNLPQHDISDVERWLNPYDGLYYGKTIFTLCFLQKKHCWNLWGKIFRTGICKKVLSDIVAMGIKEQLLRTAEDRLLYFMLSYTAQSYKGITTKKYYQYYYGRGGSGHIYYTLHYFKELCRESYVSVLMAGFLEKQGTLESYGDILADIRQGFLTNTVWTWSNKLADEDKTAGFDLMLNCWHSDEVIGKLAELRFNDTATLAKILQGSVSLRYDGHPVKTVATYCDRLAYGGTERVLCRLCYIWIEMGYSVVVITDQPASKFDYPLPAEVKHIVLSSNQSITPQNFNQRATLLYNIIKKYNIDTFIHHRWWMECILFWDELIIKSAGASFILFYHNIFSLNILTAVDNIENRIAPFILSDACVTLSGDVNYEFWKHYNNNVHETINPPSENIETWTPAPFKKSHRILWLGRLATEKRPLDAILIIQEVIRVVPDAVLYIIGKSEDGKMETILQNRIAELHLDNNVIYAGFQKDVRPWYLSSQVFLMTSIFEGYPMTLQESKMAGIPCVMYELPYLTLCEGKRGLITVPQGDIRAAAQAVIKLLLNDTLCAQYGRDARSHIEELTLFDFKKKWRQIFESVQQTHEPCVSKAEKLMMETLIAHHSQGLQAAKDIRDREINRLKQSLNGSYIKRVARAVVPNRIKPYLKAIVHKLPQGIKDPVKRLLRW